MIITDVIEYVETQIGYKGLTIAEVELLISRLNNEAIKIAKDLKIHDSLTNKCKFNLGSGIGIFSEITEHSINLVEKAGKDANKLGGNALETVEDVKKYLLAVNYYKAERAKLLKSRLSESLKVYCISSWGGEVIGASVVSEIDNLINSVLKYYNK